MDDDAQASMDYGVVLIGNESGMNLTIRGTIIFLHF